MDAVSKKVNGLLRNGRKEWKEKKVAQTWGV